MHVTDRKPGTEHADCRKVSQVLARVGDKWSVLIMQLAEGALRFGESSGASMASRNGC